MWYNMDILDVGWWYVYIPIYPNIPYHNKTKHTEINIINSHISTIKPKPKPSS